MNYTEEQIQEALRVAEAIMRGRPYRRIGCDEWTENDDLGPAFNALLQGNIELKPEPRMVQLWKWEADGICATDMTFIGSDKHERFEGSEGFIKVGKPFPWPEDV